ncbi:ABC transporter, ATP-binding protein [Aeromicrobium marinum DSM 15272]|uniref:ABC transporter, ATP-binding protein n=1 Tax=Aeromicrobium marinum DSM 15272 TaxID=585531 RepID=E2SCN5_9ACTN|nr:metal ABC transporter ATP-binding protein [Aeromicrobium marinum]EFQ82988.1 ABC transporter, ATP-binding protein [Aeromicrobium marinum DSM 15272]
MTPAVEVRDLSVSYGSTRALREVDLVVRPGRVCGVIGMNGSGKSTLFKALTDTVRPDRGEVRILGGSPAEARRHGRVAYVPQEDGIDRAFPVDVREIVMMGRYGRLGPTRRPRAADHEAVDAALERVDLTRLARRQVGQLSGGQRKRAFVARGIAQDAAVLLLDEPFAGVDRPTEAAITALLRELAAEGRTLLVATHDLHGLAGLCDEAVALRNRVVLHGPIEHVLAPEHLGTVFGLDEQERR